MTQADDQTDGRKGGFSRRAAGNSTEAGEIDSHSALMAFLRPARELMIWSLLVGKLQMAELFWTMEKEPIAGALLSSTILKAMVGRTDDFTDKEDFQRAAAQFEDRAWGVLDQCYREDERRAQFLINRELSYYGDSSCIYLAAEGESIKFMAHPCCQDFLTGTWFGRLSSKNTLRRFLVGTLLGLACPPLVAMVMLYKTEEAAERVQPVATALTVEGTTVVETLEIFCDKDGRDTRQQQNAEKPISSPGVVDRLRDFYMAPVIRFIYNTISYLTFLIIFSYLMLFHLTYNIGPHEIFMIVWMMTLLLEEVKQATMSGISFSTYISDSWNKLDCLAVVLFFLGLGLRLAALVRPAAKLPDYDPELTDGMFSAARVCYACSLFAYYIRLVYIVSFHMALGPKLIMIGKMVSNDLVPFMVILLVFVLGYGVTIQSIAYPTGLFTPDRDYNGTRPARLSRLAVFASFLSRAYFQMFGNFALDTARANDPGCKEEGRCPHWAGRWLAPLMLAVYVLLTNILMFNLLIAMFSSTYESINQFSALHWNYQRYSMIKEYLERSPLAPPLITIWQAYQILRTARIGRGVGVISGDKNGGTDARPKPSLDPLKVRRGDSGRGGDRELVKWEHMKAADYQRAEQLKRTRRGAGGGTSGGGSGCVSDTRREIVRAPAATAGVATVGAAGASSWIEEADAARRTLAEATGGLGEELEHRFRAVDAQIQRISSEALGRTASLAETIRQLSAGLAAVQDTQLSMLQGLEGGNGVGWRSITPLDADMVERIRRGLVSSPPSWFSKAATRAAALAIRNSVWAEPPPPPPPPSTPPPPPTIRPRLVDPAMGRVVQHLCRGHRLWRFAPFNFERYPGMRMNVPPERAPWQIEYRDYFAFDVSDEAIVFPSQEAYDSPKPAGIQFNIFDARFGVERRSLLGPYALDEATGAPLNPNGRTGLAGRGLLPRWGPNSALVVVLTRWHRSVSGALVHRLGKPILQVAALLRHKQFCLPWFLTDHQQGCDSEQCSAGVARSFVNNRLLTMMQQQHQQQQQQTQPPQSQQSSHSRRVSGPKGESAALHKALCKQTYKGYLDDHLNADNAWIEAVVVNIHESESCRFSDVMLAVFAESDCEEQARWMEVAQTTSLRGSHCELLKSIALDHGAFY